MSAHNLLNTIETIKHSITDAQYKAILDELMMIHNEPKQVTKQYNVYSVSLDVKRNNKIVLTLFAFIFILMIIIAFGWIPCHRCLFRGWNRHNRACSSYTRTHCQSSLAHSWWRQGHPSGSSNNSYVLSFLAMRVASLDLIPNRFLEATYKTRGFLKIILFGIYFKVTAGKWKHAGNVLYLLFGLDANTFTFPPHFLHLPPKSHRPFLVSLHSPSTIPCLDLHLTQYAFFGFILMVFNSLT